MDNSTETEPQWLRNYKENPPELPPEDPENPAGWSKWVKGMPSPNAKGRPKGLLDRRIRVSQALHDEGMKVARVVIDAALAGDIQAASLVLSRVTPPIKAQALTVQFQLSPESPLSDQAGQILQAVANGSVDPETGRTLITCLNSVASIKSMEDLEQRIVQLEAKAI